jgi:hypothetical protein
MTNGVCVKIPNDLVVTEGRLNLLKRVPGIHCAMPSVKVSITASLLTRPVYGHAARILIEIHGTNGVVNLAAGFLYQFLLATGLIMSSLLFVCSV